MAHAISFPSYTATELALDRALHLFAVPAAAGAAIWLLLRAAPTGSICQFTVITIYGGGLIGTFVASAAYTFSGPGRRKELLRRVDHAMIFVMIAGTCTPFALSAFTRSTGLLLCSLIWTSAIVGITLKFVFPRRFERSLLGSYLIMGWGMLGMGRAYAHNLSDAVLLLLLAGGAAYSCEPSSIRESSCHSTMSHGMRSFSLVPACIGRQSPTSLWIGAIHRRPQT